MKQYKLVGTVTCSVEVVVSANSLEEAIAKADEYVGIEEYCGGQVGIDYEEDDIENADMTCDSYNIDWTNALCEEV